jgi:hypothetical protein
MSVVAMIGSYHGGGHCSVGASSSEMRIALLKSDLDKHPDLVADVQLGPQ